MLEYVTITLGGQTLLRYATLPKYNQTGNKFPPNVRFAISDPSSYIYFDRNRPHNRNGLLDGLSTKSLIKYNNLSNKIPYSTSFSFGYPNISWNLWKVCWLCFCMSTINIFFT